MLEHLREDWITHERDILRRGLWVMVVYRFGRWRYRIRPRAIRKPFSILYKLLKTVCEILTGIELPSEASVGKRFKIEHFGDIIVSGDAVFGDDVVIRNGVTVGCAAPVSAEPPSSVIESTLEPAPRSSAASP